MEKKEISRLLSQDLGIKDWVGEVVDNNDPEIEFRCKVKVYGLFDELETDMIPWAFPAHHGIFAGGGGGYGSGSVPKIGSLVKVRFANGDMYAAEYYAIQNINSALQSEISGDYQGTHVLAYDSDADLKVLYQPGTGVKIHLKESHVTINPDESITIEHSGTESIIELVGQDINIVTQNDVNVTCENNVKVEATNVIIDQSDSIELGSGASEKVILGDSFLSLFNQHTHIGNLGAPTAPPTVPMTAPLHLSGKGATPVTKVK
jgi:hypothetical protein